MSDSAFVELSNFAFDSITFQVVRHKNGDAIPLNIEADLNSEDAQMYVDAESVVQDFVGQIQKELEFWAKNIEIAQGWLEPTTWNVKRGLAVADIQYAALAFLYDLRASKYENQIVETLAKDMQTKASTVKERIRKAREKGFLSTPGRGAGGQGEITTEATKLLKKEGML
jgi:cell division protein YceG involved in septum cleavage